MTKKRFKHHMGLICEKKDGEYYSFTVKEVCDLLNTFYDENKQLKQENKKLREDLEHCANQFTNDGKNVLLSLR